MQFKQMFTDDTTKQLSLSRVICALLVLHYLVASIVGCLFGIIHDGKFAFLDFPLGLAGLVGLLYYGNKGSSTAVAMTEIKNAVK